MTKRIDIAQEYMIESPDAPNMIKLLRKPFFLWKRVLDTSIYMYNFI